jgi:hypothetical protein
VSDLQMPLHPNCYISPRQLIETAGPLPPLPSLADALMAEPVERPTSPAERHETHTPVDVLPARLPAERDTEPRIPTQSDSVTPKSLPLWVALACILATAVAIIWIARSLYS